ncbi:MULTISPECIES: CHAT domain-containing protein [Streptomyces]|uniref:CHAT domain-containing protein n=1 Tax=Streptomyces TaxID=1883 RepID=UPI0011085889|nr:MULTISPECIES: CHAT domain-containing protein [Streptomyces]
MFEVSPEQLHLMVKQRLLAFFTRGDPSGVLAPDVVAAAAHLLRTTSLSAEGPPDEVAATVAWVHWIRWQLRRRDDERGTDFQVALELFGRLASVDVEWLPFELRPLYAPPGEGDRDPRLLSARAEALLTHSLASEDEAALDEAIELLREAGAAGPDWSVLVEANLGAALQIRHSRKQDPADLTEAIDLLAHAVELSPKDAVRLSNLSSALAARARSSSSAADLDEAVRLVGLAVEVTPPNHPDHPDYLSNLATRLVDRFERGGMVEDLDHAVDAARRALACADFSHPNRHLHMSAHSKALMARFERLGTSNDIDEAITAQRANLAATAAHHPRLPAAKSALGIALAKRFDHLQVMDDIDEAIGLFDSAGDSSALGAALTQRSRRSGDVADLDRAIATLSRAIDDKRRKGVPRDAHEDLNNLGGAHLGRFMRIGDSRDVDDAVDRLRQAVGAAPEPLQRAPYLSNLCHALQVRHEHSGRLADLDEAVQAGTLAVAAMPGDHPYRIGYLSNLALVLRTRFLRTFDEEDIDRAIAYDQEAFATASASDPERPRLLSNLGGALATRFERNGGQEDLEAALAALREAVRTTPPGHPTESVHLHNLGAALATRYERNEWMPDLDEAVLHLRRATRRGLADHPERARYLSSLGAALGKRYAITRTPEDAAEAADVLSEAARMDSAAASCRIDAATRWCSLAAEREDWPTAVRAAETAVGLLSLLAWRGAEQADSQHRLRRFTGQARFAASCALQSDSPARAVELAEQGRGVMWSRLLDTRADLSALRETAPGLAARLDHLRMLLDAPARPSSIPSPGRSRGDTAPPDRSTLAREWDDSVEQVRQIDGFTDFLRPLGIDRLLSLGNEGPVVLVNISSLRCDALILAEGRLRVRPLPTVTEKELVEQANRYLGSLLDVELAADVVLEAREAFDSGDQSWAAITAYTTARDELHRFQTKRETVLASVLEWLWDRIAEPVLADLGFVNTPEGEAWPRMWWCPTGALTLLPLHAAGHHADPDDGPRRTVVDRVVSSYTPTLRALLEARLRAQEASGHASDERMLLVAMSQTPRQEPLQAVRQDIDVLTSALPGRLTLLENADATWDAVKSGLPKHRWTHFSCHGDQNVLDPLAGGLTLFDKTLTVGDLSALSHRGEFVFLSACKSATGSPRMPDEALTMSAVLHYTGYRHVIAALWSIADDAAADVARLVYRELVFEGVLHPEKAAHALHTALLRLREDAAAPISSWIPFTHTGP